MAGIFTNPTSTTQQTFKATVVDQFAYAKAGADFSNDMHEKKASDCN